MKNRIISKILTCILATAIVISGSFFINKNYVYGDTTIPSTFFVNGSMYQSSITSLYGNTYQIPEWLYNQRFNITQNGYSWAEVYDMWFDIVNEDLLTTSRLRNLENLYKISNSYLPTDVSDTVGGALGSMVGGTATGNTSKVLKKWLGFIGVLTINTIIVNTILDLGKKVFNSLVNTEKNYDVNAKEWKDLGSNGDYSLYQNYYKGLNGTDYNTGTTTNSAIYNNSNNKITDIVNNNQHYVTNYTYDLNNNNYDFTTDDGYQYKLFNATKYVEIQSLINGVSNTYYQYFKLPNGDNSYNLTEDEIHGLKTDFSVSNYNYVAESEYLRGLYHFNGDYDNSAYYTTGYISSSFIQKINNYVYVNEIWDTAGYLDLTNITSSNYLFKASPKNYINLGFRLMPSFFNNFNMVIKYYDTNNNLITKEYGIQINDIDTYVNKTGSSSLTTTNNGNQSENILDVVSKTSEYSAIQRCQTVGGSSRGTYVENDTWHCACAIDIYNSTENSNTNYNYTQWFLKTDIEKNYIGQGTKLNYNAWNNIQIFTDNKNNKDQINININGSTITSSNYDKSKELLVYFTGDNYMLIDELFFYRSSESIFKGERILLPRDTNLTYILPNNVKFNNNTILLKTKNTIGNYQIGGVRPTVANFGDVYISVNELGIIDSIQQYSLGNWVSIDGAIYSEYLGKFVGLIGYSIYSGDNQYKDIEVQDVKDISSLGSWLSESLNSIKTTIEDGFNALNEKIDKLLHNDTSVEQDVFNKVNEIEDIQSQLDEEEILDTDTQLQDYATGVSQLATATNGIFTALDDNNLQILYIAPICILLLRLII